MESTVEATDVIKTIAEIPGTARLIRLNPETDQFQIYALVGVPDPEIVANLQAVYSRDPRSVTSRIDILTPEGARKFMEKYYVNYGHNSIADCAVITLFFEGVPMHVAKKLQRDPRYNGQEFSTRYMNLSETVAINSHNLERGALIQAAWLNFYRKHLPTVKDYLRTIFPARENESTKLYNDAIEKRAFDILRAFLPVGTPTSVSSSATLRLSKDHLLMMAQDTDLDTRLVGQSAFNGLMRVFPGTFSMPAADATDEAGQRAYRRHLADIEWQREAQLEDYRRADALRDTFAGIQDSLHFIPNGADSIRIPPRYLELLRKRPLFTELTLSTNAFGRIQVEFTLDYGSFRDLQRHRALDIDLPYLDVDLGFHPWYIDQLPPSIRQEAIDFIAAQTAAILALSDDPLVRQPYVAMGFRVPVLVDGPLHGWIYMIELRSRTDVHPTLRNLVRRIGTYFNRVLDEQPLIHIDTNDDDFSRRRATATIIDRTTGKSIGET